MPELPLAPVREDLEAFTAELFEAFTRNDQRRWGRVYLRGLLMGGGRKSVEPMAARLGADGNRQALAHFVTCRARKVIAAGGSDRAMSAGTMSA